VDSVAEYDNADVSRLAIGLRRAATTAAARVQTTKTARGYEAAYRDEFPRTSPCPADASMNPHKAED
jgi:hypothetical protein